MRTERPAGLLLIAIVAGLVAGADVGAERQDARARPDLTGRWTLNRELSEDAVIETYERAPDAPQLVVTTKAEMNGQVLNVRRVYDATPGSK